MVETKRDQDLERIAEIQKKLMENRFHLVVLGQFKRGKSTFINSILGDAVLPTSVIPLTSIVTLIGFGQKEEIQVILQDGSSICIDRGQLADFVTEKGNPKNKKNVKHVEISFPSSFLKDGIYIIDTPGVGSIFENNTDTTYGFLPKVDAAVFMVAADPPISQSEVSFLHDVRQYVQKIFFLQNKVDYLSLEERDESMKFTFEVLKQALETDHIQLLPVSAKLALEGKRKNDLELLKRSGLLEFESLLTEFLTKEKGKMVLQNSIRFIQKVISDIQLILDLEYKAFLTPIETLEDRLSLFQQKMQLIRQEREDVKYYFEGEIQRIIDALDRDLERFKQENLSKLEKELHTLSENSIDKSTDEYIEIMEKGLEAFIIRAFDNFIVNEEKRLNELYFNVSKRLSEKTNEIIELIIRTASELFEINLQSIQIEEQISEESKLYYLIGETPKFFDVEGVFDYFSKRILPKKLSKKLFFRNILKKLAEELEKNSGRVRWDFMNRIRKSFMDFRWELNKKIDMTEEAISTAIKKVTEIKQRSAEELESFSVMMEEQKAKLQELRKRLEGIEAKVKEL